MRDYLTRGNLVVGGTLLIVLLLVLMAVMKLWGIRDGYDERIERIVPRIARLEGLALSEERLKAASGEVQVALQELAYAPGGQVAMDSAAMQQTVRSVMTEAEMSVSGSQILPPRREENVQQLGLDVTAEGSVDSLAEVLIQLRALRPLVVIENVTIKPSRTRRPQSKVPQGHDVRRLSARFTLVSFKLLDPAG